MLNFLQKIPTVLLDLLIFKMFQLKCKTNINTMMGYTRTCSTVDTVCTVKCYLLCRTDGRLNLVYNETTGDIVVMLENEELFVNRDVFIHRQGQRLSQAEGTLQISAIRHISGKIFFSIKRCSFTRGFLN